MRFSGLFLIAPLVAMGIALLPAQNYVAHAGTAPSVVDDFQRVDDQQNGQSAFKEDTETYPECSSDPEKLQWLLLDYRVPCASALPADLTFNTRKKKCSDAIQATATAIMAADGSLTNVVDDPFDGTAQDPDSDARILGAAVDGADIVLTILIDGYKDEGKFDASTCLELIVGNRGGTYSLNQHTSCSQTIAFDVPIPLDAGSGSVSLTRGCGDCLVTPTATEKTSWGDLKSLFR